jgi:hypothetical protein
MGWDYDLDQKCQYFAIFSTKIAFFETKGTIFSNIFSKIEIFVKILTQIIL